MTNIIIVGYPKSGNTWVARLVAELIVCPVVGFWNSNKNEVAREGQNRKSNYQCFKSHYQLHELDEIHSNDTTCEEEIIYVIRDPRDIAISGAHYFFIKRWPSAKKFFLKLPKIAGLDVGWLLYTKSFFSTPLSYSIKIEKMIHAVLYGSGDINPWVRIPWNTHYKPYLKRGCFFVRYEDLLANPEHECKRILDYLGLFKQDDQIREAIERQSFKKKRNEFLKKNDLRRANLMRAGNSMQWKNELTRKQKRLFVEILSDDLKQFAYPTDDNCSSSD